MAFTTIQGSGANDATTFVGTSGVDFIALAPGAATSVSNFSLGALGANDVIQFTGTKTYNLATLRGGDGNDSFTVIGTNDATTIYNGVFINGNAGEDTINTGKATIYGSTFQGGAGNDTITFNNLTGSLVNGNKGVDAITVVAATNSNIFGGQDNDTLTISGAIASTVIQGDDGNDIIGLSDTYASSTINGGAGNDTITVGAITAFTKSTVFGGSGNDTITAAASNVAVAISGDDGNDIITGSGLNDTIIGGAGNDTITGGNKFDIMTGGAGNDTFAFAAGSSGGADKFAIADVITDFVTGTDKVQFTGVADVVSVQQAAVQSAVTALAVGTSDAQIATAMALASTTDLGVSFAVFNGNSYALFETTGSSADFDLSADVFIKFSGLTTAPIFANDVVA